MPKGKRPPAAGIGRKKGVPNKVTADVREAFSMLVKGNTARMQTWLDAVAKEDPAKALDLMAKLAEYVIPRLARSEVSGPDGAAPLVPVMQIEFVKGVS